MKVLVMNCGSSSLKYQLIDMENESDLAKGICERIGADGSVLTHKPTGKDKYIVEQAMPDHGVAVQLVLDALQDKEHGVIESADEITAIGHRVLHAGTIYSDATLVTEDVKKVVRDCFDLGPLHNPANLIGIEACEKAMPGKPNVAVFDTAFGMNIPKKAAMYAIPYEYYEKYKVRRYGFHGTSHSYVSKRTAEVLGRPYETLKTVVCHLGNGSSISAVLNGKSVDTSMGITPLEGLVMGTRSGDVDPGALQYIMHKENMDIDQMLYVLNKKSGVYGMSGVSSDFRDVENAANDGNEKAAVALESFAYRVAKYVGAYATAMGGVDAITFTAGVGENDKVTRKKVCEHLAFLGIQINDEANGKRGQEIVISTPDSKVSVLVIPTNEELAIARETLAIVESAS